MEKQYTQTREYKVKATIMLDPDVLRKIREVRAKLMVNDNELSRSQYINTVMRQHFGLDDAPEVKI